jgi:hypothetical protein
MVGETDHPTEKNLQSDYIGGNQLQGNRNETEQKRKHLKRR